jgi:hypothetical protein
MFYLKLIDRPRKFGPGPRMASCCPLMSISSVDGINTRVMDYEKISTRLAQAILEELELEVI